MTILKLNKQDPDVVHCINRATGINNALFLGKVNRIGLRDKLFLEMEIAEKMKDNAEQKEYFKTQEYDTFESYYKGVHCYGVATEEHIYICLLHVFYDEKKRNFRLEKLRKEHSDDIKVLLDKYLMDLAEFAKYNKMLGEAETEVVKIENGITISKIKDTGMFPKGFNPNPKNMILSNVLKIKGYLEEHEILKPMQEYNISVFDLVENKKYAYVTKKVDEDYILR